MKSLNIYIHISKNYSSDTYALTNALKGLKEKVYEKDLRSDWGTVGANRSLLSSWTISVNWIFTVCQALRVSELGMEQAAD